jgi:heat shock protein HslJ
MPRRAQAAAAAALLLLATAAACKTIAPPQKETIEHKTWRWIGLHNADGDEILPDESQPYTLRFMPDGLLIEEADCNLIAASYTTNGASMTLTPGAITMTYCGPASLFTRYIGLLSHVSAYSLHYDSLSLTVDDQGTRMIFKADPPI